MKDSKCCKHSKECELRLEQGPIGPTGPTGPTRTIPSRRMLKVQLVEGEPTPIINEGFSWEADVPEPPDWPLVGTFAFYKATMLDESYLPLSELHNVNGGITHTDADVQHQAAIAHYRNGNLLDHHWASAQLAGDATEDSLLAQSLQDAIIGDCFYFAISPETSALTNFNYNIGSLKVNQAFKIPDDIPSSPSTFILPDGGALSGPKIMGIVTADTGLGIAMFGASGGGGAGEASTDTRIGRGGGGGGSFADSNTGVNLSTGDCLEFFIGTSAKGGTATNPDGQTGSCVWVKLNGAFVPMNFNPIPGGSGGQGGINGGMGGSGLDIGSAGGGAPLIDGVPGTPGMGGFPGGEDGGTNPRDGGGTDGGGSGGSGGNNTNGIGSGGGGAGGAGGDGGQPGEPGNPGQGSFGGGGGGGSGGVAAPGETTLGGDGGNGVGGSFQLSIPDF